MFSRTPNRQSPTKFFINDIKAREYPKSPSPKEKKLRVEKNQEITTDFEDDHSMEGFDTNKMRLIGSSAEDFQKIRHINSEITIPSQTEKYPKRYSLKDDDFVIETTTYSSDDFDTSKMILQGSSTRKSDFDIKTTHQDKSQEFYSLPDGRKIRKYNESKKGNNHLTISDYDDSSIEIESTQPRDELDILYDDIENKFQKIFKMLNINPKTY